MHRLFSFGLENLGPGGPERQAAHIDNSICGFFGAAVDRGRYGAREEMLLQLLLLLPLPVVAAASLIMR